MLDFIKNYWREIASLLALVVSVVFYMLKKPVASSLDSDIISDLTVLIAGWIKEVEVPGNGEYKKETVTNLAKRYLKKRYGRSLDDDEAEIWNKRISTIIELFLSTPQKKGELDGSQIKKSQKR